MKKLLAATALVAAISSSAFAETENMFYVGAGGGAFFPTKTSVDGTKVKPKTGGVGEVKVGYYVMDNTRVDLAFVVPMSPELKSKNKDIKLKAKGQIYALMLNGYIDLFDASIAKVFVGAGFGPAKVKAKISGDKAFSTKNTTTIAYNVMVGASAEFTPGVNGELSYRWADYGKAKMKKDYKGKVAFKGSNVVAGIRFDI